MSRGATTRVRTLRAWMAGWTVVAAAAALVAAGLTPALADESDGDGTEPVLRLVTLNGPGLTGHRSGAPRTEVLERMQRDQDQLLTAVDAPEPVYRWTHALNGFAVELDAEQARTLAGNPRVALVEENAVRRLSALSTGAPPSAATGPAASARAGAGTVIGFVDSGVDPRNRAFSDVAPLGGEPRFRGRCSGAAADPTWSATLCGEKIVGAQYFVDGFGADAVRTGDSLSPRDTHGHGTQMASIAAGSAQVPVRVGGERMGRNSGTAPGARIAAYKACWSAPDPDDDGCATADVVAAIDRAAADRVDVLNLSMAGPSEIDTVERALLGAAEAGIVVVGAAGNEGDAGYAAHPSPWVVSVGATTSSVRSGSVRAGTTVLDGRMASGRAVNDAPLVHAADAAAPGASARDARVCRAGSLDARVVADAVVVCERGKNARVAKSRAVERADGVGMILANTGRDSVNADLHAVPTVHLRAAAARTLQRWAGAEQDPRVDLVPRGTTRRAPRVAAFSSVGNPRLSLLKPDLVAPGNEVMSAVPGGWNLATGTSASAAHVSGLAARLLAHPTATPREVRSALVTTTRALPGSDVVEAGAGRATRGPLPPLSYVVPEWHYRGWLEGDRAAVNQPHALLDGNRSRVQRTITNTGDRILTIRASTEGFAAPVHVFPSWAELAPGDELTFRTTLPDPAAIDRGVVVWTTGRGDQARLTLVSAR